MIPAPGRGAGQIFTLAQSLKVEEQVTYIGTVSQGGGPEQVGEQGRYIGTVSQGGGPAGAQIGAHVPRGLPAHLEGLDRFGSVYLHAILAAAQGW